MTEQTRKVRTWRASCRSLQMLTVWGMASLLSPLAAQTTGRIVDAAVPNPLAAVKTADFKGTPEENELIQQVACSSCGNGGVGPAAIDLGGAPASCYPGKYPCDCPNHPTSAIGSFLYGFYHCINCPDPCYEPVWKPLANSAFFIDQARPVTQLRLGSDCGWDVKFPDKAEYFWAQIGSKGPKPLNKALIGQRTDYKDGFLYSEVAVDRFSMFVQTNYRQIAPDRTLFNGSSGFGDMSVGTKSLLLDCELIQITFQFKTYIPTGNAGTGLGTGHTSLEPSLVTAVKITETTYTQCQMAYTAPIGGTSGFQGSLVTLGGSLNRLLWNCGKDLQWVGTLEADCYWFTNGLYTVNGLGNVPNIAPPNNFAGRPGVVVNQPLPLGHASDLGLMANVGVGSRFYFGKVIDFGLGLAVSVTENHLVGQLLRSEFRWRF